MTAEQLMWTALTTGDPRAARAVVHQQLDEGISGSTLILDLLAPAQRAVGQHWQSAEWTVADEHAATAVIDVALSVIESNTGPTRSGGADLVVACAESEWHALPARMAAQLFREGGARVRFLGPSVPADHLREYLARLQPDAVILSATMPTALPGAARSIDAAHDVGVPVIAGGAAFGADATMSVRLGADGWLPDARAFGAVPSHGPVTAPLAWPAYLALQHAASAAASAAYSGLLVRVPGLQAMTPAQTARTREDLVHILDFLGVSLLLDDDRPMRGFTTWLQQVLASRGVPWSAIAASYHALADELDEATGALLITLADEGTVT